MLIKITENESFYLKLKNGSTFQIQHSKDNEYLCISLLTDDGLGHEEIEIETNLLAEVFLKRKNG